MTAGEQALTQFLRSRWCSLLLMIIAFTTTFFTERSEPIALTLVDRGLIFESPSRWIGIPEISHWLALVVNVLIVLLMVTINRRFNLLRSMSLTFVAMFLVMEAATPAALMWFSGGQMAALIVVWCMAMMFSVYHHRKRTKRIFLAFCLIAAASMFQYGFVVYIPVMLLGCAQMRVLSLRGVMAALLGIITPLWIVFGLGLAAPADAHLPELANPFNALDYNLSLQLFATLGLTLLTGLVTGTFNLIRVLSLNARTRALNGLLSAIGIVTGVMAMLDFTNVEFYIPLLNACTAFQIGLFFRFNSGDRAYIIILFLLAAYSGLWIWQLLL